MQRLTSGLLTLILLLCAVSVSGQPMGNSRLTMQNEWWAGNYASLTALVAAAGATPGRVIIDTTLAAVTTPTSVPATLTLEFRGNGQLTTGTIDRTITAAVRVNSTQKVTVTTSLPHELYTGASVQILSVTPGPGAVPFNGTFTVTRENATQFSYWQMGPDDTATAFGVARGPGLTIQGPLVAPAGKTIFPTATGVSFAGNTAIPFVRASWWGTLVTLNQLIAFLGANMTGATPLTLAVDELVNYNAVLAVLPNVTLDFLQGPGMIGSTASNLTILGRVRADPGQTIFAGTAVSNGKIRWQGDTFVDGNGTATTGAGTNPNLSVGTPLVVYSFAAQTVKLCTDSLTNPYHVRMDGDGNCGTTGDGTAILGSSAIGTMQVAAWAFYDTGATSGQYDDGEALFMDLSPTGQFNVPNQVQADVYADWFFGVSKDGSGDNWTQFQAMSSNLAAGQTLHISAGTYRVTMGTTGHTILFNMARGAVLAGAGAQKTVITAAGVTPLPASYFAVKCENGCRVYDLSLVSAVDPSGGQSIGINADGQDCTNTGTTSAVQNDTVVERVSVQGFSIGVQMANNGFSTEPGKNMPCWGSGDTHTTVIRDSEFTGHYGINSLGIRTFGGHNWVVNNKFHDIIGPSPGLGRGLLQRSPFRSLHVVGNSMVNIDGFGMQKDSDAWDNGSSVIEVRGNLVQCNAASAGTVGLEVHPANVPASANFDFDPPTVGSIVGNNVSDCGTGIRTGGRILAEGNVVKFGNVGASTGILGVKSAKGAIRNNTVIGSGTNPRTGIEVGECNTGSGTVCTNIDDWDISGNKIFMLTASDVSTGIRLRNPVSGNIAPRNVKIRGNTIAANVGIELGLGAAVVTKVNDVTIENNQIDSIAGTNTSPITLPAWPTGNHPIGLWLSSAVTDPGTYAINNNDFRNTSGDALAASIKAEVSGGYGNGNTLATDPVITSGKTLRLHPGPRACVNKASAATFVLDPNCSIVHLTGTTAITALQLPVGFFGPVQLIPDTGAITLTTPNVNPSNLRITATSFLQSRVATLLCDNSTGGVLGATPTYFCYGP